MIVLATYILYSFDAKFLQIMMIMVMMMADGQNQSLYSLLNVGGVISMHTKVYSHTDSAAKHTYTMAVTPLQYLSHMLLNRG